MVFCFFIQKSIIFAHSNFLTNDTITPKIQHERWNAHRNY